MPQLSTPDAEPIATAALMKSRPRVLALDLLRGLCAVAVVAYHSLAWIEFRTFYNWGLYGVYIFFIISGASMTIAYSDRLRDSASLAKYLTLRYLRLAPLYIAVCGCMLAVEAVYGRLDLETICEGLLNITFLFGFANPGQTSIVTGGWSLGIEFVFYCVFPVALAVARTRWGAPLVIAAMGVQVGFVNVVLDGAQTFPEAWPRYTQFAAFVGYFAAGVWVGQRILDERRPRLSRRSATIVACAAAAALLTLHGDDAIDSLTGFRGLALTSCAVALVAAAGDLRMAALGSRFAETLGDASYALYLLHPLVFAVLRSRWVFGAAAAQYPLVFTAILLGISLPLALFVHRKLEQPAIRRLRARMT